MKKCRVLLVGSNTKVKGGIVSVLKNYLSYNEWKACESFDLSKHINKLEELYKNLWQPDILKG